MENLHSCQALMRSKLIKMIVRQNYITILYLETVTKRQTVKKSFLLAKINLLHNLYVCIWNL